MMFGKVFKRVAKGVAREVKAEYGASQDFLEAVCAAAALVAYADGDLEEAEKRKTVAVITSNPTLGKLYQQNDIENCVNQMFNRAKDVSGRQLLARELDDLRNKPDAPRMAEDAYLIALDVAQADGEVDEKERATLEKLAARMGVDVSKFDF